MVPYSTTGNTATAPWAKAFGEFAGRILVDFASYMEEGRRRAAEWAAQRDLWREPLDVATVVRQDAHGRAVRVTARKRTPGSPSWARRHHESHLPRDPR